MIKSLIAILIPFCCLNCSKAGLETHAGSQNQNGPSSMAIRGFVGLGQTVESSVSILDVSDVDNPVLLNTVETDSEGSFFVEISDDVDKVLFVASGGRFVDPVTFQNLSLSHYQIRSIYDVGDLNENQSIYVTPFSEIFFAYYRCLVDNLATERDVLDYARSSFSEIFDIEVNSAESLILNSDAEASYNSNLYTLYNLAFSEMYKASQTAHPLDSMATFSNALETDCTLRLSEPSMSFQYTYSDESFREDYLESLQNLSINPNVETFLSSGIDLEEIIQTLRDNQDLIFKFEPYEN